MIRSKYIGRVYDGWTVTSAEIAGRYGRRHKPKGNTYRYVLTRVTSDKKCVKSLTVSHTQMVALCRGQITVEGLESKKNYKQLANRSEYRFFK